MADRVDKNQAVIDYLMTCSYIQNNPLFFNFIEAKDNNKQIVTIANDKIIDRPYIDGSVLKRYSFSLMDYKSVSYQSLVNIVGTDVPSISNENVDEYLDVQKIMDWIEDQEEAKNYPDFGDDCLIERIYTATDNPMLNGVDTSLKPALAKYSITIQIEYLDTRKQIWNND